MRNKKRKSINSTIKTAHIAEPILVVFLHPELALDVFDNYYNTYYPEHIVELDFTEDYIKMFSIEEF